MSGQIITGENLSGNIDIVQSTIQTMVDSPKDFFTSSIGGYILGSIVILLYIVFVIRTIKDSTMRYRNSICPILTTLLVAILTPIFGIPIYLAIRPSLYKTEKLHWREALDLQTIKCFGCGITNHISSKHCIFCGKDLHLICKECKKEYPYDNPHCPHCGAKNKSL